MIPLKPTFDEFRALSDKGNLIPVYTELAADYETPVSAFRKLQDGSPCFLLESAESSEQIGRFSFLGFQPRVELRAHGRDLTLTVNGSTTKRTLPESEGDPLHELERIMSQYQPVPLAGLPVFTGGAVGYLAYDMVRFFEPTPCAGLLDLRATLSDRRRHVYLLEAELVTHGRVLARAEARFISASEARRPGRGKLHGHSD